MKSLWCKLLTEALSASASLSRGAIIFPVDTGGATTILDVRQIKWPTLVTCFAHQASFFFAHLQTALCKTQTKVSIIDGRNPPVNTSCGTRHRSVSLARPPGVDVILHDSALVTVKAPAIAPQIRGEPRKSPNEATPMIFPRRKERPADAASVGQTKNLKNGEKRRRDVNGGTVVPKMKLSLFIQNHFHP